jgi:hypothetical protein
LPLNESIVLPLEFCINFYIAGYDITSGDRKAVYRVEEFPGLAFHTWNTLLN